MNIQTILLEMCAFFGKDIKRVNHLLKVYAFAQMIGKARGLDDRTQQIVEVAAAVHDIGIKESERKYGSSAGKYQEKEGPPLAKELLSSLGCDPQVIQRVCYLVAHHHTYDAVDGMDYRILLEADFLVNAFEDGLSEYALYQAKRKIFRTDAGKVLLKDLYGV